MQAALGGGAATPEGVPTAVALSFYPHGAASHQPRLRRPPCRLNLGGGDRRIPLLGPGGASTTPSPCPSLLPGLLERLPGEALPGRSATARASRLPARLGTGHLRSYSPARPWHLPAPTVSGAAQLPATPGPGTSVRPPLPQPLGRRPVSSRRPQPLWPPPRCCPGDVINSCW